MDLKYEIEKMQQKLLPQIPEDILKIILSETEKLVVSGLTDKSRKKGDIAPSFTLPNAIEKPITSSDLLKEGPLVVSFYRGGWCPYCNLELHALQNVIPEINVLGAQLVAISPQTPDRSLSTREKHGLIFEVLSDVGNKVARGFGLVFTLAERLRPIYKDFGFDLPTYNGDNTYEIPIPATYVITPDNMIVYSFLNADYSQRAEPADIVEALKSIKL